MGHASCCGFAREIAEAMAAAARPGSPEGMRHLAGGTFTMGSRRFYPEEAPPRQAKVGAFWIDETPVTNADFARFVAATGHLTVAEQVPSAEDYPGLRPDLAWAGSMVFDPRGQDPAPPGLPWWRFRAGACWHRPLGPGSSVADLARHPVVHVALADAQAYARWAGKALPTEAEWEFAARGGLLGREYAWGDELAPDGTWLANVWQGDFPWHNTHEDGWERTSPVRSFPANGYGLYDMIGNVWEWTRSPYGAYPPAPDPLSSRSVAHRGQAAPEADDGQAKVVRGGAFNDSADYARCAFRGWVRPDDRDLDLGLRVVLRSSPV